MTDAGRPVVGVIGGSRSDFPILEKACAVLAELDVPSELRVVSAHRTPAWMTRYAESAAERGLRVIIAGAGGAAHLPGMVAAQTLLPVIGVPIPLSGLDGLDSLLSIVQMPRGVPVATVAIGNAENAALLAARILALDDADLRGRLAAYRERQARMVLDDPSNADGLARGAGARLTRGIQAPAPAAPPGVSPEDAGRGDPGRTVDHEPGQALDSRPIMMMPATPNATRR